MSTQQLQEAARVERSTAAYLYRKLAVLHYAAKLLEGGFPVSGDMIAHERRASLAAFHRRRRVAARIMQEVEAGE